MRKSNKTARNASANVPAIVETVANESAPLNDALTLENTNAAEAHDGAIVIDGTTGETVQPETVATEAKPDPRAARAERIAADRAAVRALYASFESQRQSVPVKPLSAFKLASTTAHPIARNVSQRQCAALAVAFTAAGRKLATGAKAPRVFEIDGKPCAIENGVLRDAVSSGLCTIIGDTPESEIIVLSKTAAKSISAQLGEKLLSAVGII